MARLIVAVIFSVIFSCSHAQGSVEVEHLVPGRTLLAGDFSIDYYRMITEGLKDAYTSDVVLKVLVLPSFSPERAIGLRKSETDGYDIFTMTPKKQYWGYYRISGHRDEPGLKDLVGEYPSYLHEIPISRCQRKLDADLALQIINVWREMLFETRYSRAKIGGFDGTSYHFSMGSKLAGVAKSPKVETKPGMLVSIASLMSDYCQNNGASDTVLMEAVVNLAAKLKLINK